MAQVLVRGLPEEVVQRLKAKAAAEGRSLEAHLRIVLEEASQLDRDEFLALADASAATRNSTRRRGTLPGTEVLCSLPDILVLEVANALWAKGGAGRDR